MKIHGNTGKVRSNSASISPTTCDLYWAAGFLEGEGCFSSNHSKSASQVVTASQVQADPLRKLQSMFGGHFCLKKENSRFLRGKICQPIHGWSISGGRARGVMMTLFNLMSPKRKREIKEALHASG